MYVVFFILSSTTLLYNCSFGVLASQDQQCVTFLYDSSSPGSRYYLGNSWYRATETGFPWFEARDECRKLGGVLAAPSSAQENEFIAHQMPPEGILWIDCNDLDVEGRWKCREGNVEVAYRNWDDGEPSNEGDEDCAVLTKRWENQQCSTFMRDDSSCPESWHSWGISCYRVTETRFTWSDAKDECRNLGGVLGAPSSDQENEFIAQLFPLDDAVWIDCNDIEDEGRWKCREGNVEVAYRNWYPGEPNNYQGDEDCAVLASWRNERQWHDGKCSRLEKALCKMAGRPVLHV
ncbi:C-type mannose receptor 2-like [Asterias amurensis]|uniref:C-type mannose receptor 2-like n=1 Tax=Asterias amurensis TaxID=7602 RepID=UPI003AB14EF0